MLEIKFIKFMLIMILVILYEIFFKHYIYTLSPKKSRHLLFVPCKTISPTHNHGHASFLAIHASYGSVAEKSASTFYCRKHKTCIARSSLRLSICQTLREYSSVREMLADIPSLLLIHSHSFGAL